MIDRLRASTRTQTALACLAYLGVSVLLTWPLARHLGRDVAWDLGDSVLNIWILAWDVEKFRSLLGALGAHRQRRLGSAPQDRRL